MDARYREKGRGEEVLVCMLPHAADGVDVSASMFGRVFCTGLTRASGLVARRSRARSAHA